MSPAAMYSLAVRTICSNSSRETFDVTSNGAAAGCGGFDSVRSSSRSTNEIFAHANW